MLCVLLDLIKDALSVWHKEQSNLSTVHHFDESKYLGETHSLEN